MLEREPYGDNLEEIKIDNDLVCIIETVKNPNCHIFHTPFEISDSSINSFYRPLTGDDNERLNELGETGKELIERVFDINGITEALITPYRLSIIRATCFDWESLDPQIVGILKEILKEQQEWAKFKKFIED